MFHLFWAGPGYALCFYYHPPESGVYHVRLFKYAWRMSLVQFNSFWLIFILKIMAWSSLVCKVTLNSVPLICPHNTSPWLTGINIPPICSFLSCLIPFCFLVFLWTRGGFWENMKLSVQFLLMMQRKVRNLINCSSLPLQGWTEKMNP